MGRISVSLPDELLARARKRFGRHMSPAIRKIVERGLSDAMDEPIVLDNATIRSLSNALEGESILVDDAFWEAKIGKLKQRHSAKRRRSA